MSDRTSVAIIFPQIVGKKVTRAAMEGLLVRMMFGKVFHHGLEGPKLESADPAFVRLLAGVDEQMIPQEFIVVKFEVAMRTRDIFFPRRRRYVLIHVIFIIDPVPYLLITIFTFVKRVFLVSLYMRDSPSILYRLEITMRAVIKRARVVMHHRFVLLDGMTVIGAVVAVTASELLPFFMTFFVSVELRLEPKAVAAKATNEGFFGRVFLLVLVQLVLRLRLEGAVQAVIRFVVISVHFQDVIASRISFRETHRAEITREFGRPFIRAAFG